MPQLNPENQFVHSMDGVQRILAAYNLTPTRYKQTTSGIENLTLQVWCGKTTYVLRVYRQNKKSDTAISRELDFMTELKRGGLPVPTIIPSADGRLFVVVHTWDQTWQCVLMEFMPGHHPTTYTRGLLTEMAANQAKIHLIGQSYTKKHGLPCKRHLHNAADLDAAPQPGTNGLSDAYCAFLERARTFEVTLQAQLPYGLGHFDYAANNLLLDDSKHITAVLDFDDMQCMPLIVCLGFTLWNVFVSASNPQTRLAHYLRVYESVRPLSKAEKNSLAKTMLFRHYLVRSLGFRFGSVSSAAFAKIIAQEQRLQKLTFEVPASPTPPYKG
ncbi:MAG TPA: phosphotransferase [Patescibacteria group bacterium]|nr:phosphotransferase [Patescibacteria group bacterium]